jgi:hypothetical protein
MGFDLGSMGRLLPEGTDWLDHLDTLNAVRRDFFLIRDLFRAS